MLIGPGSKTEFLLSKMFLFFQVFMLVFNLTIIFLKKQSLINPIVPGCSYSVPPSFAQFAYPI